MVFTRMSWFMPYGKNKILCEGVPTMIELQPFGVEDFDTLIRWVDSEETLVQFAGQHFNFPLTATQLAASVQDMNRLAFKVTDAATGISIGHAEIHLPGTGTAVFCRILIGDAAYKGKGLCHEIIKALLTITFMKLDVEQAELNVFDWNIPAIKCYQRNGFVINPGKTRERVVNGKIWTALNMVTDKSSFLQQINK